MSTQEAVEHLINELRKDPDYYYSWQANIAMAFQDEYYTQAKEKSYINSGNLDIHDISNKAAKRFLDILLIDVKKIEDGNNRS